MKALEAGTRVWIVWGTKVVANGRPERNEISNGLAAVEEDCPKKSRTVKIWFGGCGWGADIRTLSRNDVYTSRKAADAELARRRAAQRVSALEAAAEKLRKAGYTVVAPAGAEAVAA